MSIRRCYWGDLRLPKRLRRLEVSPTLQAPQVHMGLDRDEAAILAVNKNWKTQLTAKTFWDPEADYTRLEHERYEVTYHNALKARANHASGPWPLFDVIDKAVTVTAYSNPTVTAAGHGFTNGDFALIRRLGATFYTLGAVSAVSGDDFEITEDHAIANGDDVFTVHRYWLEAMLKAPPSLKANQKGNHFEPSASHVFLADQDGIVIGAAVDLDA